MTYERQSQMSHQANNGIQWVEITNPSQRYLREITNWSNKHIRYGNLKHMTYSIDLSQNIVSAQKWLENSIEIVLLKQCDIQNECSGPMVLKKISSQKINSV